MTCIKIKKKTLLFLHGIINTEISTHCTCNHPQPRAAGWLQDHLLQHFSNFKYVKCRWLQRRFRGRVPEWRLNLSLLTSYQNCLKASIIIYLWLPQINLKIQKYLLIIPKSMKSWKLKPHHASYTPPPLLIRTEEAAKKVAKQYFKNAANSSKSMTEVKSLTPILHYLLLPHTSISSPISPDNLEDCMSLWLSDPFSLFTITMPGLTIKKNWT